MAFPHSSDPTIHSLSPLWHPPPLLVTLSLISLSSHTIVTSSLLFSLSLRLASPPPHFLTLHSITIYEHTMYVYIYALNLTSLSGNRTRFTK